MVIYITQRKIPQIKNLFIRGYYKQKKTFKLELYYYVLNIDRHWILRHKSIAVHDF